MRKQQEVLHCLSDDFDLCFKISKFDSFMISYCYFDEFKHLFRLEGSWETSFCYVVRAILNIGAMLEYVETSILSICHSDLLSLHIKNEQVDIKKLIQSIYGNMVSTVQINQDHTRYLISLTLKHFPLISKIKCCKNDCNDSWMCAFYLKKEEGELRKIVL